MKLEELNLPGDLLTLAEKHRTAVERVADATYGVLNKSLPPLPADWFEIMSHGGQLVPSEKRWLSLAPASDSLREEVLRAFAKQSISTVELLTIDQILDPKNNLLHEGRWYPGLSRNRLQTIAHLVAARDNLHMRLHAVENWAGLHLTVAQDNWARGCARGLARRLSTRIEYDSGMRIGYGDDLECAVHLLIQGLVTHPITLAALGVELYTDSFPFTLIPLLPRCVPLWLDARCTQVTVLAG